MSLRNRTGIHMVGTWDMGHGTSVPRPTAHGPNVAMGLLCLSLVVTGCSAVYNGERLFWKAKQLSAPIVKDPQSAPSEQIAKAIDAFNVVTKKTPGTIWAARAHIAIGSLYSTQKQYDKAREAYQLVLQNYNQFQDLCLAARFMTAKTYEVQQDWNNAVKAYQAMTDYHPWSKLGLEAPLHIAQLYESHEQPDQATHAYEQAIGFYTKLIPDAPRPELAVQVKGYLVLTYHHLKQWTKEIATLEDLAGASSGVDRPLVLVSLGSLYESKLHDAPKAQAVYTKLAEEFPDHPFGQAAKQRLERLGIASSPKTPQVAPPASSP